MGSNHMPLSRLVELYCLFFSLPGISDRQNLQEKTASPSLYGQRCQKNRFLPAKAQAQP
jgi:hypothetical protein